MDKIDIFEFTRAYTGFGLFAWWGIWCVNNGYTTYTKLGGFIISLGGII